MRIVLLNPLVQGRLQQHRRGVGHLGLGYVAACLKRKGHSVRVIDAKTEGLPRATILQRLRDFMPSLFGVTAMTHEICEAGAVCADVKKLLPQCVTVVGGPHATALPERTLMEFPGIDIAVIGEGEVTACELAEALESGARRAEWSLVSGIAYREKSDIYKTGHRPFMPDLDGLPFPAWELFPPNAAWPIFAGRGCPFRCAFCQRVLGDNLRLRSVPSVLAEIDAMEEILGVKGGWFQDETFGVNIKWTHDLLDELIQRNKRKGYIWHWKANSRANLANMDVYRKMKRAGCVALDFGIESGSEMMLKRVGKDLTVKQACRGVSMAKAAGLKTTAFFIIGHPGETWGTALQTTRFAMRLKSDEIAVGVMVPYPGTKIYELAAQGEYGYRLLSEDWRRYDKYFGNALALRNLSHRELELLQVLTYLAFYVSTGQLGALWRFVSKFREEAIEMARRLLWRTPHGSNGEVEVNKEHQIGEE